MVIIMSESYSIFFSFVFLEDAMRTDGDTSYTPIIMNFFIQLNFCRKGLARCLERSAFVCGFWQTRQMNVMNWDSGWGGWSGCAGRIDVDVTLNTGAYIEIEWRSDIKVNGCVPNRHRHRENFSLVLRNAKSSPFSTSFTSMQFLCRGRFNGHPYRCIFAHQTVDIRMVMHHMFTVHTSQSTTVVFHSIHRRHRGHRHNPVTWLARFFPIYTDLVNFFFFMVFFYYFNFVAGEWGNAATAYIKNHLFLRAVVPCSKRRCYVCKRHSSYLLCVCLGRGRLRIILVVARRRGLGARSIYLSIQIRVLGACYLLMIDAKRWKDVVDEA